MHACMYIYICTLNPAIFPLSRTQLAGENWETGHKLHETHTYIYILVHYPFSQKTDLVYGKTMKLKSLYRKYPIN